MYTVKIRDHIMIAHSLGDSYFGPAQNMHGATYIVDAIFYSREVNEKNVVIDIGLASKTLNKVLEPLNYKNLDEIPEFRNELTTTEYIAKYIHDALNTALKDQFNGTIEVVLGESHVAWASYSSNE